LIKQKDETHMTETLLPAALERRREDFPLITGHGHYVDDIRLAGRPPILHMAVVRSIYGHAEIQHISLDAARVLPGVVAAFAASELVDTMPNIEPMPSALRDLKKPARKLLATQRARYMGDPVAVVLAEDVYTARDAIDLIDVDYIPLPAVIDPEAAVAKDAPLIYEEFGSNIAFSSHYDGGDIDKAFAKADHITRLRVVNQRIAANPMEPRACLFDFDPATGELTAWLSSQAIYRAREMLAHFLDIDRTKIHVLNADVGGAFGTKTAFLGEEIIAAALAVRLGRPVKWMESRTENLQSQTHGRGQINYIEAAVQQDGHLLGLKVHSFGDLGAFLASSTTLSPNSTAMLLNGPYRIEAIHSQVIGSFTNKVPTAAYRGAGRPEATYILERVMDRIALELAIDPVELRRRNFISPDSFPYQTLTGGQYDSGNYEVALDRALELADYKGWRTKQKERRQENSTKQLGIGLATVVEISGGVVPNGPQEAATVRIRRDGSILVQSGVATNGQGHFTAFAQLAAEVFHIPDTLVTVEMNNSALPAFSIGTFGSRTMQTAGSAIHLAAVAVRDKAIQVAARRLEVSPDDLELLNGHLQVRGVPARAISLGELAALVEEHPHLIQQDTPNPVNGTPIEGLAAWHDFAPIGSTYSSGTSIAIVEVETDTGVINILQFIAVDDCGTVLNHYLSEAQVHGSLAQGIGQALYEEIRYDEEGQMLTSTLMDYALPNAQQVPSFITDFVETPSPLNPLGAKGVGEGGTISAPPAIVNAALDALSPLAIKDLDMPLTLEKVWSAIQAARAGRQEQRECTLPEIFHKI
jgi:aerobic carbon-monoxide dehydrogenase large subunit